MSAKKPTPVMDVSHPGKAPATATSRPVLVTNRPVIKDDVVTEGGNEEAASAPILTPAKKVVIKPLHPDTKPEAAPEAPQPTEPVTQEQAKPEVTNESEAVPITVNRTSSNESPVQKPQVKDDQVSLKDASGNTVTSLTPEQAPAGVPDPNREDKQLSPDQSEIAARLAAEHRAELTKLVEDEKYFLPINAVQERRSRRVALIGLFLVIVLVVAWYDIALDAGLMPNLYNLPHTTWFSVK